MRHTLRRRPGGFFGLFAGGADRRDRDGMLAAIDRSQAVVEFAMDGTVLHANAAFLAVTGYALDEIRGRHHRQFVHPSEHDSPDYHGLWARLRRGEFDAGQYRRIGKGGREIWIQASYNPLLDASGRPYKVVKFATDITEQKRREADAAGQLAAIDTSMAVIEFAPDGTILRANANFLGAMGYAASEIAGRHHSMFVDPAVRDSAEYRAFWAKLARGEYDAGQYRRIAKGGREVWIEASYNPILDPAGRPYKVVKYATDVTAQKRRNADFEGQIAAITKSQAVIEFTLSGEIVDANANFLACVGYTLAEIRGKHHRMFVPAEQHAGADYRAFWEGLGRGEPDAGQYRRVGRDGREIWLQASYNPIVGPDGRAYKVVKYATDVTAQVRLADGLKAMMRDINVYAGKISTASKEIAAGNADLSTRTEAQAANLEETASSMEELTSTVKRNADSARQANQLAHDAADVARRGGDVVQSVVATMEDIHASSRRIGDIIGVIDGIAFQTNILALNAAVEAARAGEQGRGFAVVAAEVRSLAQRCAEAAKDIKTLISQSGDKVAQGSARVEEAGRTMSEILGSIERVNAIVRDISTASEEQSSGIDQVNRAVMQMDQATQQNAALVEQASAASRSLDEQAAALFDTVTGFVRDNGLGEEPPARTKPQLRRVV